MQLKLIADSGGELKFPSLTGVINSKDPQSQSTGVQVVTDAEVAFASKF